MAFQRGDVVLIPFPFTDLSATKTRPSVVVSSPLYHGIGSELLLAYVSSQITKAHPKLDHVLNDWSQAGLLKPSFVRPRVSAIEPSLVVHQVGQLTVRDLLEVDRRLRQAMALIDTALPDILQQVDLSTQPAPIVQLLAEKALTAIVSSLAMRASGANIDRLREILSEEEGQA